MKPEEPEQQGQERGWPWRAVKPTKEQIEELKRGGTTVELQFENEREGTLKTIVSGVARPYVPPIETTSAPFLQTAKVSPAKDLYKAGMHLEQQKFKNIKKARQLLLSETGLKGDELEREVEVSGLDLSEGEDRAISALQILLDRSDYKGNLPSQEITTKEWKFLKVTPAHSFTWAEYFEAYGLKRRNGQFRGKNVDSAKKDLENLATKTRRLVYSRRRWDDKKKRLVYDMVVWTGNLIQMLEGYEGLDKAEALMVEAGQPVKTTRRHKVAVVFSPVFIDGILNYFLLKPVHLHGEIRTVLGSKRSSPVHARFLNFLLTLSLSPLPINENKLIEVLRLDGLVKHRQKARARKILQECYEIAKELGYLHDYRQDAFGLMYFTLNPERCRRVKGQLTSNGKQEPDETDSCKLE